MNSKFALIIANSNYQDPKLAQLAAPAQDAEALARVLQSASLAAFQDVRTLINETEHKARMAIEQFFLDRKPDDLLLLYFSGHGIRDEEGQLFLAAVDTDHTLLDSTAVPAVFITRKMNNSRARSQVLILDCCNSGAFATGTKAEAMANMGMGGAFEGTGYGRVVLTATDATQYAWEGEKITGTPVRSVFTENLVKGLEGEAALDGESIITVDNLYEYAFKQTKHRNPKQTPEKWTYHEQGKIILSTQVKPETVKPVPLDRTLKDDLRSTRTIVREAAVRELGTILTGSNRGKALTAEQLLDKVAANDDSRTIANLAGRLLAEYREKFKPQVSAEETPAKGEPFQKPQPASELPKPEKHADVISPTPDHAENRIADEKALKAKKKNNTTLGIVLSIFGWFSIISSALLLISALMESSSSSPPPASVYTCCILPLFLLGLALIFRRGIIERLKGKSHQSS